MPSVVLPDVAAQERCDGRAQIDPHVKDVESVVPLGTSGAVKGADDRRDVRLEHAVSADEQSQGEEEGPLRLDRHQQVTGRHEDASDHNRQPPPEDPVGQ